MRCSRRSASSSLPLPRNHFEALGELHLDVSDRLLERWAGGDVVAVGVHGDAFELGRALPGQRIEFVNRLDFVAEQRQPPAAILVMGGKNLRRVAPHPEGAAHEIRVVPPVLQLHQPLEQRAELDPLPLFEPDRHFRIGLDRADAVNAGHAGDDDHVAPLKERPGGGMAHPIDLLVYRGVLLDIGVAARHICLGLVIVVIGDEVLDRVVGEKAPHFSVELSGQRLVGREDQGGAGDLPDDMRHREGLARAGNPEQDLVAVSVVDARDELRDRLRLIAGRLEAGDDLEGDAQIVARAFGDGDAHGPNIGAARAG